MTTMTKPIAHVRTRTGRPDRRIAVRGGASSGPTAETLCGAAPTAYDMERADARRAQHDARWNLCLACLKRLSPVAKAAR